MMRKTSFFQLALALLLGLAAPQAWAIGELNGRISGKVLDASNNSPLPGAEVTATSSALIGGPKTTATADDGFFEFVELPPGDYVVEVKYEGVKPLRRQVEVKQGQVTPLRIAWSLELAANQEEVLVEGERLMTKPESTTQGTVLDASKQAKVASARSYQSVTQQVAGVSGGANPNVRGANMLMNRYLIDGLDITDPVTNTFSSNINFDSIQSIAVLTGGMEAQYNSMGGVINLVTTQGSDEFHADASVYANHWMLSAPAQYGSNPYEGYKPFDETPRPPTQGYQANMNVSGPVVKEKLWFAASLQYSNAASSNPAGPPLNFQGPNRVATSLLGRAKLTWAPDAKNRVTVSGLFDPASFDFQDFATSTASFWTPLAARRQNQGGYIITGLWQYQPVEDTTLKVQLGGQRSRIENGPQGMLGGFEGVAMDPSLSESARTYDASRPRHTNLDDGTVWYNREVYNNDRRYTFQLDTSIAKRTKLLGQSHEFQAGLQGRLSQHRLTSFMPGGAWYRDQGGGPGEAGLCLDETTGKGCFERRITAPNKGIERAGGFGVYVQDRYKPVEWLTILPGVRFDWGRANDMDGRRVATLWGFGPRLGAVADVTGDQKTILSVFYGRANETLSLLASAYASPGAVTRIERFNQTSKAWDLALTTGGPGSTLVDARNHTPPHTDEVLVSARRQVAKNTSLGLDYTYKRISNIWDQVQVNQIYDPSGMRVIGYRNGEARSITMLTRPEENWVKYQSLDFILEGRPTPELEFYSVYTLGFRYGPGTEQLGQLGTGGSQFSNPRQAHFYDGYAFGDIRHQLKFSGAYTFGGLSIGPNVTFSTGTALAKRHQTNDAGVGNVLRSPVGTLPGKPNDATSITEFRTPDLLDVNMRMSYDFEQLTGQKFTLIADAFNLFNLATPTAFNTTDQVSIPNTFGTVTSRIQPLRVQLGVRYQY